MELLGRSWFVGICLLYCIWSIRSEDDGDDTGALYLTPYIESGRIIEAQNASLVKSISSNIISYSGYFTVNKTTNSNYFFWYFPSTKKPQSQVPLLLWLQGGSQSYNDVFGLFGLFFQHGPYVIYNPEQNVTVRDEYAWTDDYNVLYVDAPIGTGFSFTQQLRGYEASSEETTNHLYDVLGQFYRLFPKLSNNSFYIASEYNGARPAILLAERIQSAQRNVYDTGKSIKLKGLIMFSPFMDYIHTLSQGPVLYQAGMIDGRKLNYMQEMAKNITALIHAGMYEEARKRWMYYDYAIWTAGGNYWDYNDSSLPVSSMMDDAYLFLNRDSVRNALHVGRLPYQVGDAAIAYQSRDTILSVLPALRKLLKSYKVLFCSGQFDIVTAYPVIQNVLRNLQLEEVDLYHATKRENWYVDDQLVGYRKQNGNLSDIFFRNANHYIPMSQPKFAYEALNSFAT